MKRLIFRIAGLLGVAALFRHIFRQRVLVLMYHGVVPDDETCAEGDWLQVRASEFRAQIAYLARHYEVCNFDRALSAKRSSRPLAIVTFDDGYANNCRIALPILREFGVPATVFVSTGFVDTQRWFWWDRLRLGSAKKGPPPNEQYARIKALHPSEIEAAVDTILDADGAERALLPIEDYRALSRREISELTNSGLIELGSHTNQHEILTRVSDGEIRATLEQSAACLREWGCAVRWFAAPNGDIEARHAAMIRAAGFEICVGTQAGLWSAPNALLPIPRIGIGRGLSVDEFALAASGALVWARSLLRRGAEQS